MRLRGSDDVYAEYQQGYEHHGHEDGCDGVFSFDADSQCESGGADVGDYYDGCDERCGYGHLPLPHRMTRHAGISLELIVDVYPAMYQRTSAFT